MVKAGIIGAGRMGKAHAGNLAKLQSVKLTAVYDIDPAQAAAMKENYPTMEIMDSAEALVNSPEVDLIIIASPTYCHKEGIMAAMATGKPIFCEKPLCRTQAELDELAPMLRNYNNLFAIGFVRRYSASFMTLQQLINDGKIGKLIGASVNCLFGAYAREWGDWFTDYQKSGGVILDMLAHHCDLLNALFGKPEAVYARAMMLDKNEVKPRDYVSATVTYKDNSICNMECSWLRGGPSGVTFTIYGEKGALKTNDTDISFYDIGGTETKIEVDEGILGPLQESISGGMYATEMATITDCVLAGKKPAAGVEEAISAMEFSLAMMKSAETGEVSRI